MRVPFSQTEYGPNDSVGWESDRQTLVRVSNPASAMAHDLRVTTTSTVLNIGHPDYNWHGIHS